MEIKRIDHYSIRTLDVEASRKFYTEIIGLKVGPRPPFEFPGLWLYNGKPPADLDHAQGNYGIVHVMGVDREQSAGAHRLHGRRRPRYAEGQHRRAGPHRAGGHRARRHARAVQDATTSSYFERTVPVLGLHQVFIKDPNGVTIELNFPASEAPRAESSVTAAA